MVNPKDIIIETDVLVIGAGWAGFFAAIKARESGASVTLVDKGYASRSGASSRNDGHMTVFNEEWGGKLESWHEQTAVTGEYLNNPTWTEITCLESYERYLDILSWGIAPPRDKNGEMLHPFEIRYPGGIDAVWLGWGYDTMPFVRKYALKIGVNIADRVLITDLLKQDDKICGAVGVGTQTGDFHVFKAKSTILCTGTSCFKTQAPASRSSKASFDGEAMAYRAGGEISGMEFSVMARWKPYVGEFPPDAPVFPREGRKINHVYSKHVSWLYAYRCPLMLLGNYIDSDGHGAGPFHPYSLMTVHEGKGPMLLDVESATDEEIEHALMLYPPDYERFKMVDTDPVGRDLYSGDFDMAESFMGRHMGGSGGVTSTDYDGGTSLPGLFGAGDAYHSAASGSVYPNGGTGIRVATVSGARAGRAAAEYAKDRDINAIDEQQIAKLRDYALGPIMRKGGFDPVWASDQISSLVIPYYVFGVRSGERLKAALTMLEFLEGHVAPLLYARDPHELAVAHETRNRVLGAKMIAASSLFREESRGLQYREDFPSRDDEHWHCHVKINRENGQFTLSKMPVGHWWPDHASKPYLEKYPKRYRGEVIPE